MKRILCLITALMMTLALFGCGNNDAPPSSDEPRASWKVPGACAMIDDAFSDASVRRADSSTELIDYGNDIAYAYVLPGNELIVVRVYSSAEKAETCAGYYSADGTVYSWPENDGDPKEKWNSAELCYFAPVHLWRYEDCIIEYVGESEVLDTLNSVFGEQFAGAEVRKPDDDLLDGEVLDPPYIIELIEYLDQNGLYKSYASKEQPVTMFEFTPKTLWTISLTDGLELYAYEFETEEQAEKHASNYSPGGAGYSYELNDGSGMWSSYEAELMYPEHLWRNGTVVYNYGGLDDTAEILTNYFGEQFAGRDILDVSQIDHPEVAKLARFLNSHFMYYGYGMELISEYSEYDFSHNRHTPVAYYTMCPGSDYSLSVRIYDSPESAADEASNYGPDGSMYNAGNGAIIIDYASPVHFWLSGDAIIELGIWGNWPFAQMLDDFYGGQFAGDSFDGIYGVGDLGDGELGYDYTDVPVGVHGDLPALEPMVITSWDEYTEFTAMCGGFTMGDCCLEQTAVYNERFFEERSLIILPMYEGSISYRHSVESVIKDGDTVKIRTLNRDTGDEAEDFCLIFIELEGRVPSGTKIELERVNTYVLLWNALGPEGLAGAKIIRTDSARYDPSDRDEIKVITSKAKLDEYTASAAERFQLGDDYYDAVSAYNDEWFENGSLIVFTLEEGSGSIRHEVTGLSSTHDGIVITVRRDVPETGTDDMADWHFIVETNGKLSGYEWVQLRIE